VACLSAATESFNRHCLWQVPHRHRTKAESDKEAVTPGYGTVRAIRWAAKTNKG